MSTSDDRSLLRDYAASRSEPAFRALVERHSALVFAAALRQVGDRGLAEEVAQNVFVALARNPSAFRYGATLSSWLYRTTLLQARQTIRRELRRHRREETAVELGNLSQVDSDWAPLIPMLDEAILGLRERERVAVVLRYLEDKPFRDVAGTLGISEEAARKRVSKAVEIIGHFFRRRGFTLPAIGTLSAPLFTEGAKAMPVGLAATITQFALNQSSLAPASAGAIILTKLMTLTNTQTALVCLAIGAIPAAISWNSLQLARNENFADAQQQRAIQADLHDAQDTLAALIASRRISQGNLSTLQALASARSANPQPISEPSSYPWSDSSEFARVPKSLLTRVPIPAGLRGTSSKPRVPLSDELKGALHMTPDEAAKIEALIDDIRQRYHQLENSHTETSPLHVNYRMLSNGPFRTNGAFVTRSLISTLTSPDSGPEDPVEIVSFRTHPFPEERRALWAELNASILALLGPERSRMFLEQAETTIHQLAGEMDVTGQDNWEVFFTYLLRGTPNGSIYLANARVNSPDPSQSRIGDFPASSWFGGGLLDASEDPFAPDAAKPILARWRAQISGSKPVGGE